MAEQPLLNNSGRLPITIDRGEGLWLIDTQGERYLDTFTGLGVCPLGHAHPAVREALAHQAGELTHCSNLFHSVPQQTLATRLRDLSGMDGAFFANSGAEANEAAIKLARQHGHKRGLRNPTIIVMEQAYHGRTIATLSAGNDRRLQAGAEPLLNGFVRVPFNDLEAVRNVAAANRDIVAVLVEPIQSDAGVIPASNDFMNGLAELCRARDWLLMLDETQTAMGRTGSFFTFSQYNVFQQQDMAPDVLTLACGLTNGFPMGVCLARGEAATTFRGASHGSTFGGGPLACAAALAVISTLENEHLVARARALGNRITDRLREHLEGAYYIRGIRAQGLLIGIELQEPCPELAVLAKTQGLLVNVTAERVVRLLPALTMTDREADDMAERVIRLIKLYMADERKHPRR